MKKVFEIIPILSNANNKRSWLWSFFPAAALLCLFLFLGNAFLVQNHKERLLKWGLLGAEEAQLNKCKRILKPSLSNVSAEELHLKCKSRCRSPGSESLPEGIVCNSSDLEMKPLWGRQKNKRNNLFTVSVGIKQKETVDRLVRKFLSSNFSVMLFHYDGYVDRWKDLEWGDLVIHVSAVNQTKWWFAKRFLHPDIVAEYEYVFLWDEDLGVDDFHPERYLEIVKEEGLEISQPALDITKSELHHQITSRSKKTKVHRRIFKPGNSADRCDENSKTPPCTGWIEVMAPVFSSAAWRCVWYMIQNDLIHAWGLDMQLGYCAQGDRAKNVGVVDSEYIVHYGLPTLGENVKRALPNNHTIDNRVEVRRQSYRELKVFKRRWQKAAKEDMCWVDPYRNV